MQRSYGDDRGSDSDLLNGQHSAPAGKIQQFEIFLDRSSGVFAPGEVVTGNVSLELAHRMAVQKLSLLVQGTGNVSWQLPGRVAADDEIYLNEIAELVDKAESPMVALSAGEHLFPFACDLPADLPTTFKAERGSVAYLVKAVLCADSNELLHREPSIATCEFAVQGSLPLEDHLLPLLNYYRIDQKQPLKQSSMSLGSNAVKVSLFLTRRAFGADDAIVPAVDLLNSSRRRVTSMGLALVMEAAYRAGGEKFSERRVVVKKEDNRIVPPNEARKVRDVELRLPTLLPPSELPHSNLITVKYWLVFRATVDRSTTDVLLQVPLAIGVDIPEELKAREAADMPQPPSEATNSVHPRLLFQGSSDPAADRRAISTMSSPSRPVYEPLSVQVDRVYVQSRPMSEVSKPTPQLQYFAPDRTDTQTMSMHFSDELDDINFDNGNSVTRNPLFDQSEPGSSKQLGQRHSRMLSAFDAGINDDTAEVLY